MRGKERTSLRGSIEDALTHAWKLINTGSMDADFDYETKKRISIYVRSWIIPPLERALKKATKKADREEGSGH